MEMNTVNDTVDTELADINRLLAEIRAEQAAPLRAALRSLPTRPRSIFVATALGVLYKDLAPWFGVPVEQIDSWRREAMTVLRPLVDMTELKTYLHGLSAHDKQRWMEGNMWSLLPGHREAPHGY